MVERGADPSLVVQLAHELQRRIGIQPIVKVNAFSLPNASGIIYRILYIQPGSMSEISRVIRAARTMKLHVRCVGRASSLNKFIMMNDFSVVLDLKYLSDSERIERVQVRKKDLSYLNGIKILAGVTVGEFCEYQVRNQMCVQTNVEELDRTIIGSIMTGASGAITSAKRSLADYVIQMRIMDIHGEIRTYANTELLEFTDKPNSLMSIVSSLGMLGVVYDVILQYEPLITVNVDYKFVVLEEFFDGMKNFKNNLSKNMSTQLVYIPFNSVTTDCNTNEPDIGAWSYKNDEILIRTMNETQVESDMRQIITVIDEDQGCLETVLRENKLVPLVLKNSHFLLKRTLRYNQAQYLPWAIHCFPTLSSGAHEVTITVPLDDTFEKTLRLCLTKMDDFVHGDMNFSLNVGIRVHFTSGTDVTLCPGLHNLVTDRYAHIKLISAMSSLGWPHLMFHTVDEILREFPEATLQWSSEWIDRPIVSERIMELEGQKRIDLLKEQIELMDRDGVFLNNYLQGMLYPHLESYRAVYKWLQNEYITSLR